MLHYHLMGIERVLPYQQGISWLHVQLLKANGHCFYNFLDFLNQSKKSADFATVSFLDREMSAPDTKLRIQSCPRKRKKMSDLLYNRPLYPTAKACYIPGWVLKNKYIKKTRKSKCILQLRSNTFNCVKYSIHLKS